MKNTGRSFTFCNESRGLIHVPSLLEGPGVGQDTNQFFRGQEGDLVHIEVQRLMDERNLEERYGVHDYSASTPDTIMGYSSYEIGWREEEAEDKVGYVTIWRTLLSEWEEILREIGYTTGDWYTLRDG